MVLGLCVALVVIYVFLRSFGMTFVAGAIIPIAMAMTILVVERAGMSLNTFLQNFTRARKLLAECLGKRGIDLAAEMAP